MLGAQARVWEPRCQGDSSAGPQWGTRGRSPAVRFLVLHLLPQVPRL